MFLTLNDIEPRPMLLFSKIELQYRMDWYLHINPEIACVGTLFTPAGDVVTHL